MKKPKMQRNPYFMPDGLDDSERYDIMYRTPMVVKALREVRARKRQERKLANLIREAGKRLLNDKSKKDKDENPLKKNIFIKTSEQIQRGFDTAKKWDDEWKEQQNDQL